MPILFQFLADLDRCKSFISSPKLSKRQKEGIGLVEMGWEVLSYLTFRTFWLILHKIVLVS